MQRIRYEESKESKGCEGSIGYENSGESEGCEAGEINLKKQSFAVNSGKTSRESVWDHYLW